LISAITREYIVYDIQYIVFVMMSLWPIKCLLFSQ